METATLMADAAEMIICAGPLVASYCDPFTSSPAAAMIIAACLGDSLLPHTSDVFEMLRDGHHDPAASMHEAYALATFEREDLDDEHANMLDLYAAGLLLRADDWRIEQGLPIPMA